MDRGSADGGTVDRLLVVQLVSEKLLCELATLVAQQGETSLSWHRRCNRVESAAAAIIIPASLRFACCYTTESSVQMSHIRFQCRLLIAANKTYAHLRYPAYPGFGGVFNYPRSAGRGWAGRPRRALCARLGRWHVLLLCRLNHSTSNLAESLHRIKLVRCRTILTIRTMKSCCSFEGLASSSDLMIDCEGKRHNSARCYSLN